MNLRGAPALAALAIASAAAGFGLFHLWQPRPAPVAPADIRLTDLDGRVRALSEWRGKLLLVNFWATWCTPCIKEIPILVDAQSQFGARGLQIVGPAMDDAAAVREWLARVPVNYPVMAGDSDVAAAMDALGDTRHALPFSVLIGPDGHILQRQHGEFSRDSLAELVEEHLPR